MRTGIEQMPFFDMSWEEYHGLEKPAIKLESLINFKVDQMVMLNPDNPGINPKAYEESKGLIFTVLSVEKRGDVETGMIRVMEPYKGTIRVYHYQNLIIIP